MADPAETQRETAREIISHEVDGSPRALFVGEVLGGKRPLEKRAVLVLQQSC